MKTLAATLMMSATLLSAGAFASDNVEPNNVPFQGVYGQQQPGTLTRAQVIAELAQARNEGLVTNVEPNDTPYSGVYGEARAGELTREQVRNSVIEAHVQGASSNVEPNDMPFQGA